MTLLIITIALFFALTIWGRVEADKGNQSLSEAQMLLIRDRQNRSRKWSVLALSLIIVLFLAISYYLKIDKIQALYGYFAAFILYTVSMTLASLRGLRSEGIPEAYIQSARLAGILRLLGLMAIVVGMVLFLTDNAGKLQNPF